MEPATTTPAQSETIPIPKTPTTEQAKSNYVFTKKSALGMFLVAIAAVVGSIMSALVNVLGNKYKVPAPTITFTRCLMNLVINLICCAIWKVNPIGPWRDWRKFLWVVCRGLFGGIQITCYFFAFVNLPVGDATVLTFTSPVITALLAICMLKEKLTIFDAASTLLCFVGVLFVATPDWLFPGSSSGSYDPSARLWSSLIALIGSIFASLAYISVRKIGPSVHVFTMINYILVFTMLINIFQGYYKLKTFPWPKPTVSAEAWWLIVACTVCGATAQICINRGLQLEKAGPAISMRFIDIVLSYIWQVFFIHEETNVYSIIGACLVTLCIFLMAGKKWYQVHQAKTELLRVSLLNGTPVEGINNLVDKAVEMSATPGNTSPVVQPDIESKPVAVPAAEAPAAEALAAEAPATEAPATEAPATEPKPSA